MECSHNFSLLHVSLCSFFVLDGLVSMQELDHYDVHLRVIMLYWEFDTTVNL